MHGEHGARGRGGQTAVPCGMQRLDGEEGHVECSLLLAAVRDQPVPLISIALYTIL